MKTFLFVSLFFSVIAHAETLTAPLLESLEARVESAHFRPIGHGLLFSHETIESCVYVAPGILVADEYCYPKKSYPARALMVWSKELGEIELYDQDLGGGQFWREVRLNEFPERAQPYFSFDFTTVDFATINGVSRKFYAAKNPACWSSSIDFNTGKPTEGCLDADLAAFPGWAAEARRVVLEHAAWDALYARLLAALPAAQ